MICLFTKLSFSLILNCQINWKNSSRPKMEKKNISTVYLFMASVLVMYYPLKFSLLTEKHGHHVECLFFKTSVLDPVHNRKPVKYLKTSGIIFLFFSTTITKNTKSTTTNEGPQSSHSLFWHNYILLWIFSSIFNEKLAVSSSDADVAQFLWSYLHH